MKKILIIAAHPDDEVLGVGGTIVKYVKKGYEISLLIVTDGSTSQYQGNPELNKIIAEKKQETRKSADLLGIKDIYYGNLPDMKLDSTPHVNINRAIESVIDIVKPSIVFTHFWGDVNKDHRCVYESTLVACRPVIGQSVKKIFLYSVPSSTEWNITNSNFSFLPNWYENIEKFCDIKYKAMSCYKEELRDYPHPRSIDYLRISDLAEGLKMGQGPTESFMLVRNIED